MVTPSPSPTNAGHSSGGSCGGGGSLCKVVKILIIVGGLNWGLVGIGGFLGSNLNIVNILLGSMPAIENLVYLLVGAATVLKLAKSGKCCK
ncbi:hypothetical protein COU76_00605 [Candidatus Peregrinibacteria bacterium CG10_big_fil_rev_8_21_14_0_10_49_10]|nr:MAG: hypothetical protein COU76_00605 [Candidatus Peregrinibacteria bacterium CG10_big_fil_rev_8_21_14_0_10_49_10]